MLTDIPSILCMAIGDWVLSSSSSSSSQTDLEKQKTKHKAAKIRNPEKLKLTGPLISLDSEHTMNSHLCYTYICDLHLLTVPYSQMVSSYLTYSESLINLFCTDFVQNKCCPITPLLWRRRIQGCREHRRGRSMGCNIGERTRHS